jgi:hypothetical protein
MRLFLSERTDDISESTQRLVDLLGFFKSFTGGTRFSNFFTSRQVYEMKRAFFSGSICCLLIQSEHEDAVTSRALQIHVCRSYCSKLFTEFYQIQHILFTAHILYQMSLFQKDVDVE